MYRIRWTSCMAGKIAGFNTFLDFFLWGKIKNLVYATAPTTQENMRQRIIDAFNSITVEKLHNV